MAWATATFRFYGELNDFLPVHLRQTTVSEPFERRTSVKDMVEAIGVPHPEVAFLLVNGVSVALDRIVGNGDRIAAYPAFRCLALDFDTPSMDEGAGPARFALDANLGALARQLRLCGFDARYRNDIGDAELARIAAAENRIVLTRDRGVLKRRIVMYGYYVRADAPREQLREVINRFALHDRLAALTRCARCNGRLMPVAKEAVRDRLEPLTRQHFHIFRQCDGCGQVYWRGSHVASIEALIEELRSGRSHSG